MCTVPLGRGRRVPGRDEAHRSPSRTRRCRRCSGRGRRGRRRAPRRSRRPARRSRRPARPCAWRCRTVSPRWSAWPWVSRIASALDLVGVGGGLRVARQERVDRAPSCRRASARTRRGPGSGCPWLQVSSRRGRIVGPRSSRASSNPTATPTSMPSRVSSATSVRTRRSRSAGSSPCRRPRAPGASCASPNQPPSCERLRRARAAGPARRA